MRPQEGITVEELTHIVSERRGDGRSELATAVAVAHELGKLGDELVDHYVQAARRDGSSWFQIGQELGVTRQAAHQRFGEGRTRFGVRRRKPDRSSSETAEDPFSWFTDDAQAALSLAQIEARQLGHDYLGTEHLLIGLLVEGSGAAARALGDLEVSADEVRGKLVNIVQRGPGAGPGPIPFTPRTKKVLELSRRQARKLGHDDVGTEHLLLALLEEGEGLAAQILVQSGIAPGRVQQQVIALLSQSQGQPG
jgi:Clp amino terminal domain, pathogenicity island component